MVPEAKRATRTGLAGALTEHYGSPGRLADYRRQFERTARKEVKDPSVFAIVLETLAVKAFGDLTRIGLSLYTRVALLTLSRVATRLESSRTIYHIDYIVYCKNQDNVRHLAFTVKSVSFKSFDLQTPQGMRNCSTSVTAGAHYFHPERCPDDTKDGGQLSSDFDRLGCTESHVAGFGDLFTHVTYAPATEDTEDGD